MSNGPTEALNNLIKRIKRIGFVFGNFESYRIRAPLYAANRLESPQFDRRAMSSKIRPESMNHHRAMSRRPEGIERACEHPDDRRRRKGSGGIVEAPKAPGSSISSFLGTLLQAEGYGRRAISGDT